MRGAFNDWEWEGAILYSKATSDDTTEGRVAMDLLDWGLAKTDDTAINMFAGGMEGMNLEQALIDVTRSQETSLSMIDFKMTNSDIGDIGAGPIAMLIGFEVREETFDDDLDDRIDGTIQFYDQTVCTAGEGAAYDSSTNTITYTVEPICSADIEPTYTERGALPDQDFGSIEGTFPFNSAVAMSSPQPDSSGERTTSSLFVELQIPVLDNLDAQVALRHESFSDIDAATVGKIALGYFVNDKLSFRGSASTTYRAPNLITVNSPYIPRNTGYTDALGSYLGNGLDVPLIDPETGVVDPESDAVFWDITAFKLAASIGNPELEPEEAENIEVGFKKTFSNGYLNMSFFHMAVDYKKEIGFEGPFYIEPKPREPSTHQYDSDSAACLNFLREYDLTEHFKLNIETNHATLAGHTMQHELTVAMNADALGSIDANRGDELIGWDTDQFPTDIYQTTEIMLCVLKMGGFQTGGLNFDAKRRRESHDPIDLFYAHIGGMDAFARGLKIAAAIREDGRLAEALQNRYSTFDSGIGAKVEEGNTSFKELEEYALNNPEPKVASGRQEMLENLINEFI